MKKVLMMLFVLVAVRVYAETEKTTTRDLNEQSVMAVLWMQKSAEYRALCYQAFNVARMNLDNYLVFAKKGVKSAIIVDADETVIDNSAYQAHLIGQDYGYSSKTWADWMKAAQAEAVPGAVEFLKYAESKGVEVFYITNRKMLGYDGTVQNMKKLGFPNIDKKHMMLRTKSSDKKERRDAVLKDYTVVLYMGDNLNDFSSEFGGKSISQRFSLTDKAKSKFGTKFIMLPNPAYGEWEGAVYEYNWGSSSDEKDNMRKKQLRIWNYSAD